MIKDPEHDFIICCDPRFGGEIFEFIYLNDESDSRHRIWSAGIPDEKNKIYQGFVSRILHADRAYYAIFDIIRFGSLQKRTYNSFISNDDAVYNHYII